MAKINKTRYCLLGCLSLKPMTAYEIKRFLSRSTTHFWAESDGQLYPNLKKLLQERLIEGQQEPALRSGYKIIYSITELGLTELIDWLHETTPPAKYRNETLLKLFFGNRVKPAVHVAHLKKICKDYTAMISLLKTIKESLAAKKFPKTRMKYLLITLNHGIKVTQAELAWAKESIAILT